MGISIEDIARVCHEANRFLCQSLGDASQATWSWCSIEKRQSAINGVLYRLANPGSTPEQQHKNWMDYYLALGWKYGPEKDETQRTHPCLRPWAELPPEQQAKDKLFSVIVNALAPLLDESYRP